MKNIYKALAEFQNEVPIIHKDTQGYGYTYADLPAIIEIINPLLKKYGLGFTQLVNEESIKTIVFHIESGETFESNISLINDVSLSGMNKFQVLGSQITYLRRYALSAILGLVTDIDNDAKGDAVQTPKDKADDLPWLNKFQKDGKSVLTDYIKVIERAKEKNLSIADLRKHYKISKAVEHDLTKDLK